MKTIAQYLRLILFLAGILAGIQIPNFMDTYHKSLIAHLNESDKSLSPFKQDADRYFRGNLEALINHYKSDKDPVFTEGGKSIEFIYQRNILLKKALLNFNKSFLSGIIHTFIKPVEDIKKEVIKNYSYTVKLDKKSIIAGLLSGTFLAGIPEFLFVILTGILRRKTKTAGT
ncbi:MAG: DUF2937 family protein [Desulfobacteraceae bacterium]